MGSLAPSLVFPYTRATAAVRRELGLPARSSRATRRLQDRTRWPVFHGFSPSVLPRPSDWRPGLDVTGYWWPTGDPGWQPPTELVDFLAAGPAPVVVTFGSMASGSGAWLADAVVGAIRRAGVRAVVQAGCARLDVRRDAHVLPLGEAPHSWLFPRAAAVVHHGGAGTSGAVFRAGVPAVVTPIYADQPLWARRAHALGVSPTHVPFAELTADRLGAAAHAALASPDMRVRAARLAEQIRVEDGIRPVVDHLDRLSAVTR